MITVEEAVRLVKVANQPNVDKILEAIGLQIEMLAYAGNRSLEYPCTDEYRDEVYEEVKVAIVGAGYVCEAVSEITINMMIWQCGSIMDNFVKFPGNKISSLKIKW